MSPSFAPATFRPLVPLAALLSLAACTADQPVAPQRASALRPGAASAAIVDGAHGGDQHFFFLPPLVPGAPNSAGTFDATRTPTVEVCALAGTTCGATVATFSGAQVQVDANAGFYQVTWKTRDAGLDPAVTYRIQVRAPSPYGPRVLGYADVVVLANGGQVGSVDKTQYAVALTQGAVQIRFRIETGAGPSSWAAGDVVTYNQAAWGGALTGPLPNHFNDVYAASFGVLEVGIPGTSGYSLRFLSVDALTDYLPSSGAPAALPGDFIDPSSTIAGVFGGDVVALELNVDFADAGYTLGTSALRFGDLVLCNVSAPSGLEGLTVRQVLASANTALGGGATPYSIDDLDAIASQLDAAFADGVASPFAQQHVAKSSACAPANWRDGDVVTNTQSGWATSRATTLLVNYFNSIYASTFGVLEIGIPGLSAYSIRFTYADAITDFVPATGTPAALTGDLIDPTSSAAGSFAGDVLALKLDVDFSDAALLGGTSGLDFGDLTLCNFTALTALNGMTVRQLLALENALLGGGSGTYTIDQLYTGEPNALVPLDVPNAFDGGTVQPFAQAHLVSGACR